MKMKSKKALTVWLAAALAALTGCEPNGSGKSSREMRVVTFNILFSGDSIGTSKGWEHRKGDLMALLRRLNPDIAGFQEVCPDQQEWMKEQMPDYGFSGEYRGAEIVGGMPMSGSPVVWRKSRFAAGKCGTFWLSPTPDVPGSFGWGSKSPRICCWQILTDRQTGKTFCFANMHADHKSPLSKLNGNKVLVARLSEIAGDMPVVLVGDHNTHEAEPPAQTLAKAWRNAIYKSETPPKGPWRSHNGWKVLENEISTEDAIKESAEIRMKERSRFGGGRPDYIYVSDGIRVLSYETVSEMRPGLDLYYSDHFPVFADILMDR